MTPLIRSEKARRAIASLVFCALLAGTLAYTSAVLKPGRTRTEAGAAWASYLAIPENTVDVVFFGNSHLFDGVDPATVWRTSGITSFTHAGPMQNLHVSDYYVREALRTQKPRVVAIEMSSISYGPDKYNSEFHLINIGYMPWSMNKIEAGLLTTPAADRVGVFVDLWTYHSRWRQIRPRDFDLAGKNLYTSYLKGFTPQFTSREVTPTPEVKSASVLAADDAAIAYNMEPLRRIAETCDRNDIELLLFLTPTGPPGSYSYQLQKVASTLQGEFDNVRTLDLSAPGAVTDLSYETDFFDGGHLYLRGAEKASATLAAYLAETYGLTDHRGDPAYSSWDDDAARRDAYIKSRQK